MKLGQPLLKKVEYYVTNLLTFHLPRKVCFHNLDHTRMVVKATRLLSTKLNLEKNKAMILELAAWFHDTGFLSQSEGHEALSTMIASNYLQMNKVDSGIIYQVTDCIMATEYGATPEDLAEAIIMDADMFHISQDNYWILNSLLRKETSFTLSNHHTHLKWYEKNLEFLEKVSFKTDYGREILDVKRKWLILENEEILEKIQKNKTQLLTHVPSLFPSKGSHGSIKLNNGLVIEI